MSKEQDKKRLYRMERFSQDQLHKLHYEVNVNAKAIGGLPANHTDVGNKRGWLLPFLLGYDDLLWGRWGYWLDILHKGTIIGSGAIPQITWVDTFSDSSVATTKMLSKCLNHHEANIDTFADWLLWGLAAGESYPNISAGLNEHYYKVFDLFLVLDNPTDYLSYLLCEQTGKGYKKGLGYYPTPFNITQLMVSITIGNDDPDVLKRKTVHDPCIGCGAMLLPASNFFLRGSGQDISGIAVKLCKIQMLFYAPWFAKPGEVEGFDEETATIPIVLAEPSRKISAGQLAFSF
ncbi:SAM-dependent DNA methyltransferase (plasmid) [Paenibacillus sonchi]|uniref:SAM-dependent DNA methyltransferase n=1 Tax=Paenibacillus sonchi TaxID=373687 RepID=A0A974PJF3_9BACL|nr:N-6 DNA methylase [Paenibacillus sonchi]QQZ64581.1 SAM-dependent DNA methyltransferase [Paenibacillus sonchi]